MNKLSKLPFIVALCHIPLFFLQIDQINPISLKKKRIVVQNIHFAEKPSINISKQNPQRMQNSPKKRTSVAPKKKSFKKITQKKKPIKAKKKITKKKIQKAINKSLSKRKAHSIKGNKKKTIAKKTAKKDAGKTLNEYNMYLQEVSQIFKDSLTLPGIGKVKLALTVLPDGKIVKIVSIASESEDNFSYLEKTLVNLTLPKYKKNEERTFTILFSDEK